MAKKDKLGSTKRFGARYGSRLKEKLALIEKAQKTEYECPYCKYNQVKRLSTGIWGCKKCGSKFTSKAYTVKAFPIMKTQVKKI